MAERDEDRDNGNGHGEKEIREMLRKHVGERYENPDFLKGFRVALAPDGSEKMLSVIAIGC